MENRIEILTAEAVDLLKEMVAIPSPSFSEDEVCTHISNWLSDKGIAHRRQGNNIIARLSEQQGINPEAFAGKPTLMLCAHIDTVSPSNEYSFDPYKPDYAKAAEVIGSEDIVPGLGSNDDGASVVSMIAAFRYFAESMNAAQNIVLVLSCEEERSGVNGMTGLWHEIKDSVNFAIVGEPTCMQAATAERGLLVIDGTAHGVSGHAARNEGVNAIDIALQDIMNLKNHEFTRISPRMGKVNLNVTQINAGTAHNVIPDKCTFVIDIRPTEQYTNEEILNELQSICKSELKARNLSNRSSATHENSPLQHTAEALGIETFSSPTTSDWMRIDCDAIKMGPGNSSRSHKKDEFVYTTEIENGIKTYIDFINNL
jgi:acetylornithine deacetylase